MSWLRVDDKFTEHKKLIGLKRQDRWTWVEVLCYCARQGNDGAVPHEVSDVLRHVTLRFLNQCVALGLLDQTDSGLRVHDWKDYNLKDPAKAERQARWRRRKRDGDVDAPVDGRVDAETTPPAQARARGPSPSPKRPLENEGKGTDQGLEDNAASSPLEATTPTVEGKGRRHNENGMRPDKTDKSFGPALKQVYTPERGDAYARNVLREVPPSDRAAELRYQFPDIPAEELARLIHELEPA